MRSASAWACSFPGERRAFIARHVNTPATATSRRASADTRIRRPRRGGSCMVPTKVASGRAVVGSLSGCGMLSAVAPSTIVPGSEAIVGGETELDPVVGERETEPRAGPLRPADPLGPERPVMLGTVGVMLGNEAGGASMRVMVASSSTGPRAAAAARPAAMARRASRSASRKASAF